MIGRVRKKFYIDDEFMWEVDPQRYMDRLDKSDPQRPDNYEDEKPQHQWASRGPISDEWITEARYGPAELNDNINATGHTKEDLPKEAKKGSLYYKYTNSTLYRLLRAIEKSESLPIIYDGGTTPGLVRDITPRDVVKREERGLYVVAYCHTRKEDRVFKLENISLPDD